MGRVKLEREQSLLNSTTPTDADGGKRAPRWHDGMPTITGEGEGRASLKKQAARRERDGVKPLLMCFNLMAKFLYQVCLIS